MSLLVQTNGGSNGSSVWPILSSLDSVAPVFTSKRGKRGKMAKEYKQTEYSKKLRDPRWQKMRLKIMERDKFTCRYCKDTTATLNVHHGYYESGNDPWDYPEDSLITLCESCHEGETELLPQARMAIQKAFGRRGFGASYLMDIADAINDDELFGGLIGIMYARELGLDMKKIAKQIFDQIKDHKEANG